MLYTTYRHNLTIFCNPEAAPHPVITWEKNGRDLSPSQDVGSSAHIIQLPNGNLHISEVKQSDAGNYTCIATNNMGQDRSSTQLKILSG